MANPFVGEIRMFAGNFAPEGWAFCNGQLLAIAENPTLFNLIGTTYGGDGASTFQLPDLQGRVPIHQGPGFVIGQLGGTETVTLTTAQIPAHAHILQASTDASTAAAAPGGNLVADTSNASVQIYNNSAAPSVAMATSAVGADGGSQPHDNLAPFLCVSYIISLFGIFPSQA